MPTLVNLDASGAILPLAPGIPVRVGNGANPVTYSWSTLWNMSNSALQELNIYKVDDPEIIVTNNHIVSGIVYDKNEDGVIIATPLYQTHVLPETTVNLYSYTTQKHAAVLDAGIHVTVSSNTILCDGTPQTQASLGLLYLFGQQNPTGTKLWVDNNDVSTLITGQDCITVANTVDNWVNNTYITKSQIVANIVSNNITTTSEIDSVVWPTTEIGINKGV